MSYPYSAIAIDLKKLTAAFGSKDAKLEAALKKKFKSDITENAEWFADEIAKGAPTLDRAISEIIAGTVPKKSKHVSVRLRPREARAPLRQAHRRRRARSRRR